MRRTRLMSFVLLAVWLAACSPAPTGGVAPSSTEPAGPKRSANQVLKVAQTGISATLSPENSTTNTSMYSTMFDQVITFDKNFNIIPQVAEKWEFKDGNWRFFLRKDM